MPLINLSFRHGRTLEEARSHLNETVHEVQQRFGALIRHSEWSTDRSRVRLDGTGFWIELWVDAQEFYASGDIPLLGGLLGSPLVTELKQIVQRTFQKQLP
jgi:hypothetical protein